MPADRLCYVEHDRHVVAGPGCHSGLLHPAVIDNNTADMPYNSMHNKNRFRLLKRFLFF